MERSHITISRSLRTVEDIIPPVAVRPQEVVRSTIIESTAREHSKIFLSFIAVVLLMLTAFSAARASTTISYFNDSEFSLLNRLEAGIFNFLVGDTPGAEIFVTAGDPDGETVTPTVTLDAGSFSLRYKVTSAETGGNSAFCNALQVNSVSGPFSYIGTLIGMDTGETTTTGPWQFAVSFPEGALEVSDGDTCVVDLIYAGWIDGESSSNGYLDEERFILTVHAVVPSPLLIQAALTEEPQVLPIEGDIPLVDEGRDNREGEHGAQDLQEENDTEHASRGEERGASDDQENNVHEEALQNVEREEERERTEVPPAEEIVEEAPIGESTPTLE